jgi:hypothetical protein
MFIPIINYTLHMDSSPSGAEVRIM